MKTKNLNSLKQFIKNNKYILVIVLLFCIVGVGFLLKSHAASPSSSTGSSSSELATNAQLSPGSSLTSSNGYQFVYQTDGNAVVYNPFRQALWATNTSGTQTGFIAMQGDGNLVLYSENSEATDKALWDSGTSGTGSGNYLVMQTDGNLVIYNSSNQAVWSRLTGVLQTSQSSGSELATNAQLSPGSSLTSSNGYQFVYQTDGNAVVYNPFRQALWATNTSGTQTGFIAMQGDGNLVLYSENSEATDKALWDSGTSGTGSGNYLVMQTDGNLVIYNSSNQAVWSRLTGVLQTSQSSGSELATNAQLSPGSSLTSSNGYQFVYQTDGNAVVYNPFRQALWATNTSGTQTGFIAMQGDGNLVLYSENSEATDKALWDSGTSGTGSGNYLVMQTDGNLVIYNSSNQAVWSRLTGVIPGAKGSST